MNNLIYKIFYRATAAAADESQALTSEKTEIYSIFVGSFANFSLF